MRTITKQKTVDYNVYVAKDGKEFESEDACKNHEKFLDGTRKVCPKCNGRGWLSREWIPPHDHWEGQMGGYYDYKYCPDCDGKGYLDKKEVWK